jgi:hypothetical protein
LKVGDEKLAPRDMTRVRYSLISMHKLADPIGAEASADISKVCIGPAAAAAFTNASQAALTPLVVLAKQPGVQHPARMRCKLRKCR